MVRCRVVWGWGRMVRGWFGGVIWGRCGVVDWGGGMIRCGGWVDRLGCMIRGWFGSMIWGRFSFISHIGNISEKKLICNILIHVFFLKAY